MEVKRKAALVAALEVKRMAVEADSVAVLAALEVSLRAVLAVDLVVALEASQKVDLVVVSTLRIQIVEQSSRKAERI